RTPTAASSSSPTWPPRGWTASTRCSARSPRAWTRWTRCAKATPSSRSPSRATRTPCWPRRPTAWPSGTRRSTPAGDTILGLERAVFPAVFLDEGASMAQFARRVGRAKPSAIMQVAEKAKRLKAEGRDIISFSIGVPNFLPGEHVYAAAREALERDSGQYGSNRGSDALPDALLGHIAKIGL